ncbi:MAG: M20/M25/M40 family metallo-hydrolase [Erysipelotrichaceae bacterium]|nr:M20/M25/M40 family metallo-hydrolase [Erysipelotrichaceae bacterium]
MDIYQLYASRHDYPDLDYDKAAEHLSQAIRCRTVSHVDTAETDQSQFERLHQLIRENYPFIMKNAACKTFGNSLLIELSGSDKTLKPAMFIAHQDVVPVIESTVRKWIHDPFSGDISAGFIWGRGSLDIKEMLIGFLEAAEYLLSKGTKFARTVYLAFGEDEETVGSGAKAICRYLLSEGVELEFVWDESGKIRDGKTYGAPAITVGEIGMYEKGYADFAFRTRSTGGHSSLPFYGTSLGNLATAINAVVSEKRPGSLSETIKESLRILQPFITEEPLVSLVRNIDENEEAILEYFLADPELFALAATTKAPTMITPGAPAANVMPGDMEAVINYRMVPGDTIESLQQHYRSLLPDNVEVTFLRGVNASRASRHDSFGFRSLVRALNRYYPDVVFIPSANTAATDGHNYEPVCSCVLRFTPFLEDNAIKAEGIHGTNERLSIRAFQQGLRVIVRMMEISCLKQAK